MRLLSQRIAEDAPMPRDLDAALAASAELARRHQGSQAEDLGVRLGRIGRAWLAAARRSR